MSLYYPGIYTRSLKKKEKKLNPIIRDHHLLLCNFKLGRSLIAYRRIDDIYVASEKRNYEIILSYLDNFVIFPIIRSDIQRKDKIFDKLRDLLIEEFISFERRYLSSKYVFFKYCFVVVCRETWQIIFRALVSLMWEKVDGNNKILSCFGKIGTVGRKQDIRSFAGVIPKKKLWLFLNSNKYIKKKQKREKNL